MGKYTAQYNSNFAIEIKRKEKTTMRLTNNTLTLGDNVFASLTVDGRSIASINSTRFSSINDIISLIYHLAGRFAGSAKLTIRNQSRGWFTSTMIASNNKPSHMATPSSKKPIAENGQYLIPW